MFFQACANAIGHPKCLNITNTNRDRGRCFPCVPVRSAYPKDLNLINETISGDHVQHVFLYKKDLNITQQLSLENMLNQTPLAHGVATTLPDAFRVRITRKSCCQNQTQRLSQVRANRWPWWMMKPPGKPGNPKTTKKDTYAWRCWIALMPWTLDDPWNKLDKPGRSDDPRSNGL